MDQEIGEEKLMLWHPTNAPNLLMHQIGNSSTLQQIDEL